jgi:hypothetical protein
MDAKEVSNITIFVTKVCESCYTADPGPPRVRPIAFFFFKKKKKLKTKKIANYLFLEQIFSFSPSLAASQQLYAKRDLTPTPSFLTEIFFYQNLHFFFFFRI